MEVTIKDFISAILISAVSAAQDLYKKFDLYVKAAKLAGKIVTESRTGASYGSVTVAFA